MLERNKPHGSAHAETGGHEFVISGDPRTDRPPEGGEFEIDSELQAAIEYKIASSGVQGAELVLDLLNIALRRHMS